MVTKTRKKEKGNPQNSVDRGRRQKNPSLVRWESMEGNGKSHDALSVDQAILKEGSRLIGSGAETSKWPCFEGQGIGKSREIWV